MKLDVTFTDGDLNNALDFNSDQSLLGMDLTDEIGEGTKNYVQLKNKPQINGVTLTGNKTGTELGLVNAVPGKGLSSNDYTAEEKQKLESLPTNSELNNSLSEIREKLDDMETFDEETATKNELNDAVSEIDKQFEAIETFRSGLVVHNKPELSFINGGIDNDGIPTVTGAAKRLRSGYYAVQPELGFILDIPSELMVKWFSYTDSVTEAFASSSDWLSGSVTVPTVDGAYIRLLVMKSDDADIIVSDAADIVLTSLTYTDASLSKNGKAADAKQVADELAALGSEIQNAQVKRSASGAVAEFSDGAEDMPFTSLIVNIDPIQEGSGTASPSNVRTIKRQTTVHTWLAPEKPKVYGARWDGTTAQMTRYDDAANITTETSHFAIWGEVSGSYSNPFDSLYPWCDRKLCNVDLEKYRKLTEQNELSECITKLEDEFGFSYNDDDGVWVYTPRFWGRSYVDENGRFCYEVSDKPQKGFIDYPEMITARWRGCVESRTIDGTTKNVLLPKTGMPGKLISMNTLHQYAKNYGGSITTIYSIDASYLLMLVEYANFNCRVKVGGGVNSVYRQNAADLFLAAATDSTVVVISTAFPVAANYIFDIGTSNGGAQIGSFYVIGVATEGDRQLVTLNAPVTVTTENFWSVHGMINTADSDVGGKSGYVGVNHKSHAYYRGEELWGNLWMYCLGAYKEATTNIVYLCPLDDDPDNYSALNTAKHVSTGVALSATNGYQKAIALPDKNFQLGAPIFTIETGNGADTNGPIAAYYYVDTANNRIPIVGGNAHYGSYVGLCWNWDFSAGSSYWFIGASPRLKSPKGVVRGSALPMTA